MTTTCTTASNTLERSRQLTSIAKRLDAEHEAFITSASKSLEHAHKAGKLLLEAKQLVGHGAWTGWLGMYFTGSEETARVYMRVADRWPEIEEKRESATVLTLEGVRKLLAKPRDQHEVLTFQATVKEANGEPTATVTREVVNSRLAESSPCPNCGSTDWDADEAGGFCPGCEKVLRENMALHRLQNSLRKSADGPATETDIIDTTAPITARQTMPAVIAITAKVNGKPWITVTRAKKLLRVCRNAAVAIPWDADSGAFWDHAREVHGHIEAMIELLNQRLAGGQETGREGTP